MCDVVHRLQSIMNHMPKKKKTATGNAVKAPSIPTIIKRDGRIVPFDLEKIVNATWKGMNTVHEGSIEEARMVANSVFSELVRIKKKFSNFLPTVVIGRVVMRLASSSLVGRLETLRDFGTQCLQSPVFPRLVISSLQTAHNDFLTGGLAIRKTTR